MRWLEMLPLKMTLSNTASPTERSPATESPPARVVVPVPVTAKLVVVAAVATKLVPRRFVAKKLVVVADVPVAFTKVKFWSVDDPVAKRFANESVPVAVMFAAAMLPLKRPLPWTESFWAGVVEPMPTLPFNPTFRYAVPVEEATRNISPVWPSCPQTSRVTPEADAESFCMNVD